MAYDPDGRLLAAGTSKGVFLLDPATGATVSQLAGHGQIQSLAFNRDGTMLAATSTLGVTVWNLASGSAPRAHLGPVRRVLLPGLHVGRPVPRGGYGQGLHRGDRPRQWPGRAHADAEGTASVHRSGSVEPDRRARESPGGRRERHRSR